MPIIEPPPGAAGDAPGGTAGGALAGSFPDPTLRDFLSVKDYGALGAASAEPATPFQNAYADAKTLGRNVLIPAGTYYVSDALQDSVFKLARDNAGTAPKVRIVCEPGVTIKLSTLTPRLFDFNKQADGDTFRALEVDGCWATIDCNGLGGQNHTLIGTYQAGTVQTKLNFDDITVKRFKVVNVLTDEDLALPNHRQGIYLVPTNATGSYTMKNITFEDITIGDGVTNGGNGGFLVGGGSGNNTTAISGIRLRRCRHDRGFVPTVGGVTSNNFSVGVRGVVSDVLVEDCYGRGAGDTGFEFNNWLEGTARNCRAEDPVSGSFLVNNYATLAQPDEQYVLLDKCKGRRSSASTALTARGFKVGVSGGTHIGTVKLRDCSYYADALPASLGAPGINASDTAAVDHIIVENFKQTCLGITGTYSTSQTPNASYFATALKRLTIDGFHVVNSGSFTQSVGTMTHRGILIDCASAVLDIRNVIYDHNVTGGQTARVLSFGVGLATTVSGMVRGVRIASLANGGGGTLEAVRLGSSTLLTLTNEIAFADWDFSGMSGGTAFAYGTVDKSKIRLEQSQTKGYVNHAADATVARPSGFVSVEWVGSVSPNNAVSGDSWINTT